MSQSSVPCVHCSPFDKINREVKSTGGATDDIRPFNVGFKRVAADHYDC